MSRSAEPLAALFAAAKAAQANAYAPYSRFKVGAALRTPGGAIYSGGNVENAAYPEGVCAETSAVSAMAQAGERRIAEICVIGDGEDLRGIASGKFALGNAEIGASTWNLLPPKAFVLANSAVRTNAGLACAAARVWP